MDKLRFSLIVLFGMIVYLMMQQWELDYGPKPQVAMNTPQVQVKEDLPAAQQTEELQGAGVLTPNKAAEIASATASSKIISITTDILKLEIDTLGGTVRNLDLLNYPAEQDNTVVNKLRALVGLEVAEKNHAPVRLFNSEPEKYFVAQSGLISDSGNSNIANHYTVFNSDVENYGLQLGEDTLTVPLTWTDGNGLVITKTFVFKRGSYEITLLQSIQNNSDKVWSGRQYSQLTRLPVTENQGNFLTGGMKAYDGGVVYTEKDKYQKISFDDMVDENLDVATKGGWAALIQHYFASAWIPPADQENHFYTKSLKDGQFVIGSYSPSATVDSHSEHNFEAHLFAGPKIQPVMEKVAAGLELTVDYSVLTFIGKPIYWLLNQIHTLTGNWGLAIIGVTLCIKLLLFPLTQSSFRSMAKMRKVQPRLKELQDRFKDDRQRFNTEMMNLYKKEKVNPLGGCLPLLMQIPVFMSLYWVLSETVEFRQAPFLLWIQDLSVQDPFYVLPLIMGVTMKIQQGLNPAPLDPIQAKVIRMFPVVFTVFFLFFPAGLVLYWVVNNTLSILQQMYISKQMNKEGLGAASH